MKKISFVIGLLSVFTVALTGCSDSSSNSSISPSDMSIVDQCNAVDPRTLLTEYTFNKDFAVGAKLSNSEISPLLEKFNLVGFNNLSKYSFSMHTREGDDNFASYYHYTYEYRLCNNAIETFGKWNVGNRIESFCGAYLLIDDTVDYEVTYDYIEKELGTPWTYSDYFKYNNTNSYVGYYKQYELNLGTVEHSIRLTIAKTLGGDAEGYHLNDGYVFFTKQISPRAKDIYETRYVFDKDMNIIQECFYQYDSEQNILKFAHYFYEHKGVGNIDANVVNKVKSELAKQTTYKLDYAKVRADNLDLDSDINVHDDDFATTLNCHWKTHLSDNWLDVSYRHSVEDYNTALGEFSFKVSSLDEAVYFKVCYDDDHHTHEEYVDAYDVCGVTLDNTVILETSSNMCQASIKLAIENNELTNIMVFAKLGFID